MLLPIVLAAITLVILVAGFLLYAARATDAVTKERQEELVSHVFAEQYEKITHDQQSTTTWDEAVRHVRGELDPEWLDLNLGIWMYDYFGHDQTYVLNDRNQSVYAMSEGKRIAPSAYTLMFSALNPLVQEMRRSMGSPPSGDETDGPHVRNVIVAGDRPAIASVVPIISDTGRVPQDPGTEFLHISVRFLDGSLLQELTRRYLLDKSRFAWNDDAGPSEAAFPLSRNSGAVVGYFIWQPDRPGSHLLTRTAPILIAAFLLIAGIIVLLVKRLQHASAELQASEAHAQHLAHHDSLTGLPNRALFNSRLDRALLDTSRKRQRLALLYLDLDRFKNVNDTLGHPAGDDLIRELANRLSGLVRQGDFVARLGGDEFAILQIGVEGNGDVAAMCERIIAAVAKPFTLLESSAFVGISIGVAIAPEAGLDRAELVRKADIALYRAKVEGRNRFRIFASDMDATVQRRQTVEAELRAALASGDQLKAYYQPFYTAESETLTGLELLLRWDHPQHGYIPPSTFIPVAEECGLIHQIGDLVLRAACEAGRRWPVGRVAVNVSPVQLRSPNFGELVLRLLRQSGLDPHRLEVEITESVLLETAERHADVLNNLRRSGVNIALDDFGTGYSSLNHLQQYAVDRIKIDRSFVQNVTSDPTSAAIVKALVEVAQVRGISVTAEGVETAEQRDALRRLGCHELQGFLLSRPLPAAGIDALFGIDPKQMVRIVASVAA